MLPNLACHSNNLAHIYRADLFPSRPGILQSGPSRAADQVISPVVQTWRPRFAKPVF